MALASRLSSGILNFIAQAFGHCVAPAGVGLHLKGRSYWDAVDSGQMHAKMYRTSELPREY